MPKYKISKSNLKEFFGFFGKKNKPKKFQDILDNDPVLQKLDSELKDINKKYPLSQDQIAVLKKYGAI